MPATTTTISLTTTDATLTTQIGITIAVSDQTTPFTLMNGGWSPSVAGYSAAALGGIGPYDPVEEVLSLNVGRASTDAALVVAQMQKLYALRDQAEKWRLQQSSIGVLLTAQVKGSNLPPVTATIESLEIRTPNNYFDLLSSGTIVGVQLKIVRRAWCMPTETGTVASGYTTTTQTPDLMVLNFPTTATEAAADVTIGNLGGMIPQGFVLLAPTTNHLPLVNAATATWQGFSGAAPTVVTDASAYGGQYLRIPQGVGSFDPVKGITTPALANGTISLNTGLPLGNLAAPGSGEYLTADVFGVLYSTGQSELWHVQPFVRDLGGLAYTESEQSIRPTVDAAVVFLGTIHAHASAFGTVKLAISSTVGEVAAELLINYVVLRVHSPGSQVVMIKDNVDLSGSSLPTWSIRVQSNILTRPTPTIEAVATLGQQIERTSMNYRGDAFVESVGSRVAARYLATGKGGTAGWRYTFSNPSLAATRNLVSPGLY